MTRHSSEAALLLCLVLSMTAWMWSVERRPWPVDGMGSRVGTWTIDLSTAGPAELRLLPGIGAVRSRAIIDFRATRPGLCVEDLVSVPGIGPGTVERLVGSGLLRSAGRSGAKRR